jgi:hypothetical protein
MAELASQLPRGLKVVFSYYRLHTAGFSRLVTRLRAAHQAKIASLDADPLAEPQGVT